MNSVIVSRAGQMAALQCVTAFALACTALPIGAEAQTAEAAIAMSADAEGLQWGGCPDFLPPGCAIAVLHGDPGQPNADVFFRVPPKSTIAAHSHTSAERMVLVAGELEVTYEGQAAARLRPGDYAYGPAGRVHSGRCVSDVACVLFIAFEAPVDAIPAGAAAP